MSEAIYERLTPIFRTVLRQPELTVTPGLRAADVPTWDSLANVSLIISIEEAFDMRFTVQQLTSMRRVADVVAVIEDRLRS